MREGDRMRCLHSNIPASAASGTQTQAAKLEFAACLAVIVAAVGVYVTVRGAVAIAGR